MKIKIPYFKQERNLSCGLAVLRMVFAYYGSVSKEKELGKDVNMHSFGSFLTDLGIIALNYGYKATSYTFHLSLLAPLKRPFGTAITNKTLGEIEARPNDKMTLDSWKRYLKAGGKLVWEPPRVSQLEYWVEKKTPCIINVNTAALNHYWKNWDNGHYLLVDGVEVGKLSVLDPDSLEGKPKYSITKDVFLPAWAINAKRSSGYLMVIEK